MAYDLKAVLEAEVIDKLIAVMKAKDQELKTQLEEAITKLGTRIGSSTTWSGLPTTDENGKAATAHDVAMLTQTDGNYPAGMYARKTDNSGWETTPYINFDDIGVTHTLDSLKSDGLGTLTTDANGKPGSFGNTEDSKFTTPKQVSDAFDALITAYNNYNAGAYHPKGGDTTLKVVGADADENTQEFVTAKQLNVSFTQTEINTKYDNA